MEKETEKENASKTEEAMKLVEACRKIGRFFDNLDTDHADDPPVIRIFVEKATGAYEDLTKLAGDAKADRVLDILVDYYMAVFGLGFTIGGMVEVPYAEIQEAMAAIKKVIRERALLPLLPRERMAA